jgi:uncharacterized membrane protein affecting hemolysin expression
VVENLSLMFKNLDSNLVRHNSSIYKVLGIYINQTHELAEVRPLLSLKTRPHFKTRKIVENTILIMGPNDTRNQECLCWRGPAVI